MCPRIQPTDFARSKRVEGARGEGCRDIRPACAMVEARRLTAPETLVEIGADAVIGGR